MVEPLPIPTAWPF